MRRKSAIIILLFTTTIKSIDAQDSSRLLDNVVITATQALQQQRESGRNILSIKGSVFNVLPVHSVDDLLRFLPGIEVQQRGPQGSQADITIRGGTFQQVLVIIDGVKLNDPLTGHFSMYIPVHPAEIERIEILKGAASAVWGSEAVGGVVHIITKTFANKQQPQTRIRLQAGQKELFNGDAYYSTAGKHSTFSTGILSNNARGPRLRGTDGFFHLHTLNISYGVQLKDNWRLAVRVAGDRRSFNAQNYYTGFASDTANEKINSAWIQASAIKKYAKGQLQTDFAYKKLRDQYWFRPGSVPNDNKSSLLIGQLYYTGSMGKFNGYTSGIQTQRKSIRSNDRGNHEIWHAAAYGIFRQRPLPGLHLNESLRLDYDEKYGWVLVPQLNAALNISHLTIRASGGRSFRDADFTERYNNYNKTLVTSGRIGNPLLKPEKSWNGELGADYYLSNGLKFSTTLFIRDHIDLIDWAVTSYQEMPRKDNLVPGGSYALASNVEYIQTKGIETELYYQYKTTNGNQLLALAGLTWIHSANNDAVPSLYISSHAKFLSNFALSWTSKKLQLAFTANGKKRDEQKAAALNTNLSAAVFVMNGRAAWLIKDQKGKLFIQADNLMDTHYSDILGALMPGRWLSAGFEIAL